MEGREIDAYMDMMERALIGEGGENECEMIVDHREGDMVTCGQVTMCWRNISR